MCSKENDCNVAPHMEILIHLFHSTQAEDKRLQLYLQYKIGCLIVWCYDHLLKTLWYMTFGNCERFQVNVSD